MSERHRKLGLVFLVVGWLALVLWGLLYLLEKRLVWFDEQGLLLELNNSEHFEQELKSELMNAGLAVKKQVFHIRSASCSCNWRTSGHAATVKNKVTESGGTNTVVDISQNSGLKRFVPSTPAIIMFNKSSKLVYLGPYADGAFCTTGTSFVEELIPSVSKLGKAPGWLNSVAKGCYCNV